MKTKTSLILITIALMMTIGNALLLWADISRGEASFSETKLISIPPAKVSSYQIFRGAEEIQLEKDSGNVWNVTLSEPQITDFADMKNIGDIMAICSMASRNPVEGMNEETAGLTIDKAVQLVINGENNSRESVLVGNLTEDGKFRYVVLQGKDETIHKIEAPLFEVLYRKPIEFRSLMVLRKPASDIASIKLNPGNGANRTKQVLIRRENQGWFLAHPVQWPADEKTVDDIVGGVLSLRAESIAADNASDPGPLFGIDEKSPSLTIATTTGEQTVIFGNLTKNGEYAYAKKQGHSTIYEVHKNIYNELLRLSQDTAIPGYDRYRKRHLDLLGSSEPKTIFYTSPDGQLVLSRAGKNNWVASGARNFPVESIFTEKYSQVFKSVMIWKFVSEKSADKRRYGLENPPYRVVMLDAGGRQIAGISLNPDFKSKHIYAAIDGRPQTFELYSQISQLFLLPFVQFRDTKIADIKYEDAWQVDIKKTDKLTVYRKAGRIHWQMLEPETRLIEENRGEFNMMIAKNLCNLRCIRFIMEKCANLDKFGLDQPSINVVVTLRPDSGKKAGKVALDLLIGNPFDEPALQPGSGKTAKRYYARLRGSDTVFCIDENLMKALLKNYR